MSDVALGAEALVRFCGEQSLPAPDVLLHSPYRRTTQTAQILGSKIHLRPQVRQSLAPGHSADAVEADLGSISAPEPAHLLLVSHQPMVGYLVQRWLGSVPVPLAPGGFTTLDTPALIGGFAELCFSSLPSDYVRIDGTGA